jgi:hypothetical protein
MLGRETVIRGDLKLFLAALILLLALSLQAAPAQAAGNLQLLNFESGTYETSSMPSTRAGARPFGLTTRFTVPTTEYNGEPIPEENVKNVTVELPPGIVGNAVGLPQCPQERMDELANCQPDTQVGIARLKLFLGIPLEVSVPVYNLEPPADEPAQFGFKVIAAVTRIHTHVRSTPDYGVDATLVNINPTAALYSSEVTLWGVPASPIHDTERFEGNHVETPGRNGNGEPLPSQAPPVPFIANPTSCTGPLTTQIAATSWQFPSDEKQSSFAAPGMTGCDRLPFEPSLDLAPDTGSAGSPAAMTIDLHLPQHEAIQGTRTADLKKAVVTLPQGVALSPGSAEGLAACTDAQVGIGVETPAACPSESKVGTVSIATPLLKQPLTGALYLGSQLSSDPASGQMYRLFLTAEGSGVRVKLPGSVSVDPSNGQLTATFDEAPQLPFEDLHVALAGGPRAPLSTPKTCGVYTTHASFTPWSAPAGETVESESSFRVDGNCAAADDFSPRLSAGTVNPTAGESSPFLLEVTGQSGAQNIQGISTTLPKGLLAKLAGVAVCSDAQAGSGSCAAASKVGSTTVAAGQGSSPLSVPQPGKAPTAIYLAGPYKGAPYSLVFDVPAQAGPFDLGNVVVRSALRIDPETTQVTADSDPLPQVVGGIPVQYRSIAVSIDRGGFTINPTSCLATAVTSTITSAQGAAAHPSSPFQATNCSELEFKPKLALAMKGSTKRAGNPALTATLTAAEGQANIAKTTVVLPKTAFIDQRHVNNPCTRVQFNANSCPAKSVLGTAVAYSPLLDKPLEGPVYFRSNGGERQLPDIVADLNGQIHVILVGFIDSKKAGKETSLVRTRFASVPDAPVSKFVLNLKGGKRGLIQNSADLCKSEPKAEVQMEGQNGKPNDFKQKISVSCPKKKGSKNSKR